MTTLDRRLELHELFATMLGTRNVYFQPPSTIKMKYPAIVYVREDIDNDFANNNVYMQSHIYRVTVIDEDPDSEIVEEVSKLPTCRFNRHYAADNLNHDVFILHY